MKKSLVLAMALAMGVTASAYAANPFSDVPAGHWAYDAVDKLAAAGVIDGMGDGTFQGDKTMTRYEMAQIVAKAMAKGANVEKLAAEFADELDQLGVRVAKLEKKSDNVTITGQIRYENFGNDGADKDGKNLGSTQRLRTRLFIKGQINEDWTYNARIENNQVFSGVDSKGVEHGAIGDNTTLFNRGWVSGKLFGLKVDAGRQGILLADGNLYDDTMDAVKVAYGKDVKFTAYAAKPAAGDDAADKFKSEHAYGAELAAKIGAVKARVGYDAFQDITYAGVAGDDNKVWNVGVSGNIGQWNLSATYLKASNDMKYGTTDPSTNGYVIGVQYAGASDAKVGSWGAYAKYYRQGAGTYDNHTMNGAHTNFVGQGFKGYMVGANYTFAKNIMGVVEWYDLKGIENDDVNAKTLFGRVQFSF